MVVLEGACRFTGDQFTSSAFGLGGREKTNWRLTKIQWWHASNFHDPSSSLNYPKKLENLHRAATGPLVLRSPFWCSRAGIPRHPKKAQASSWLLPFILKHTIDLGPVMLHCVFSGCAYVCNQPPKSGLAPVWMRIAVVSEVKAALVPWLMYACCWPPSSLKSIGKTYRSWTLMLQSSEKKTRTLHSSHGRRYY